MQILSLGKLGNRLRDEGSCEVRAMGVESWVMEAGKVWSWIPAEKLHWRLRQSRIP